MNHYTIQYQTHYHAYLDAQARKKSLKHQLITVLDGQGLIRLGKQEYICQAGDSIWLPFNCLVAQTWLPGSQLMCCQISVRTQCQLPHQAGFVELTELPLAIVQRLQTQNFCACALSQQRLLQVLLDECQFMQPQLNSQLLTLDENQPGAFLPPDQQQQFQLALQLRQVMKLMSSGVSKLVAIERTFGQRFRDQEASFEQLCQLILGKSL